MSFSPFNLLVCGWLHQRADSMSTGNRDPHLIPPCIPLTPSQEGLWVVSVLLGSMMKLEKEESWISSKWKSTQADTNTYNKLALG